MELERPVDCQSLGGDFHEREACSLKRCRAGACWWADGSCDDNVTLIECQAELGRFFARRTCADGLCPQAACCLPPTSIGAGNETCEDLNRATCEGPLGIPVEGAVCADPSVDCTRGACCMNDAVCFETIELLCDGAFSPGVACEFDPCGVACTSIAFSDPRNCVVDARQPSNIDGTNPTGFWQIMLGFDPRDCRAALLPPSGFLIEEVPAGTIPGFAVVTAGNTATLVLGSPIEPRKWTCFSHSAADGKVCLGYLPGDVSGDLTANPAIDLGALIDCMNDPGTCPAYRANVDRVGSDPGALDITRLIDLFNGAGAYDSATGSSLPPCPTGP